MTTSKNKRAHKTITGSALDICWGAWAELGVSGWSRTHADWAIDPEPLIIFTAWLGDVDPRLRDEALDWCIRYSRYVSRVRLRNLPSKDVDIDRQRAWGEYAATVNARAGVAWPHPTQARESYRVTGRSTLRSLTEPSLVCLRMRAMFGLAARTEIMRHLLFHGDASITVAQLAKATAYTKRNVADECDALERAGVLAMRSESNRFYYSLADPEALAGFVGDMPSVRPDWPSLFDLLGRLIHLDRDAKSMSGDALQVETHKTMREIEDDLDALGFDGPPRDFNLNSYDSFRPWARDLLDRLAAGNWPNELHTQPPTQRSKRANSTWVRRRR